MISVSFNLINITTENEKFWHHLLALMSFQAVLYDSVSLVNNALAAFFSDTFKLKIEHKNMIKVSQT